jgi:Type I restriction enzyme R protein N terminus (HSDR_N)
MPLIKIVLTVMKKGSDDASGAGKAKEPGKLFIDPIPVIYPKHPYKIKEEGGRDYILDEVRKKWLLLTPEEWVRQNFIRYLAEIKKCPETYIVIERKIITGERTSRFDIVVYGRDAKPWMLVECKNMNTPVNKNHMLQLLRYHRAAPAKYLIITNGLFTWCYQKNETGFGPVTFIPAYEE